MTDRYDAITVIFERDIRDDDATAIINAIKQLRGVADVKPHIVDHMANAVVRIRLKTELLGKMRDIIMEEEA